MAHNPAQPEPAKNGQTVTRLAEIVKTEEDWQRLATNGSDRHEQKMGGTDSNIYQNPLGKPHFSN